MSRNQRDGRPSPRRPRPGAGLARAVTGLLALGVVAVPAGGVMFGAGDHAYHQAGRRDMDRYHARSAAKSAAYERRAAESREAYSRPLPLDAGPNAYLDRAAAEDARSKEAAAADRARFDAEEKADKEQRQAEEGAARGWIYTGLGLLAGGVLAGLAGGMLFLPWLHRAWLAAPRRPGDPTPGATVGLLLVPVFNLYWVFRAVPGVSARLARGTGRPAGYGLGVAAAALLVAPGLAPVGVVLLAIWVQVANAARNRALADRAGPGDEVVLLARAA